MTSSATTSRIDELIASRGSAPLAEAGLSPDAALASARERPDLEPVFLARFRSRQGKSRVEEVRAYAWPSQQIAMRHLGYRVEEARLLRLEPRRPVPFPARLYAAFEKDPKRLEELRLTEKIWERAIKQAPSKPGRAERDLIALQPAFKKLGDEVAMEMWIEAAATFQRVDNTTYAAKMLGNLLKLIERDRKVDPSVLGRTVLSAADDGVFNNKLYEFTWDLIAKKVSVEAALGFGLRVFRRLLTSGRPLPSDFVRDLRSAAVKGNVEGFEALFDSTLVWAAGLPSFWNTSRKTSSWREERTQDHPETGLLRKRLIELWARARRDAAGEAWKAELWARIQAAMPELTTYGRTVLVETLLAAEARPGPGTSTRSDAERLLEAALAMLSRPPRSADRERIEVAADAAFFRVREIDASILWDRAGALDEALRSATGDLTSFVALADLLGDLSEALGPRQGGAPGEVPICPDDGEEATILGSLPGLEAAWAGALAAALTKTEGPQETGAQEDKKDDDDTDDDDDDEDDDGSSGRMPIVALLGEAISLLSPANAVEHLAELGPLIAARLARNLSGGAGLEAWAPVLGALRALGPIGAGIAAKATARFIEGSAGSSDFGHAARLAHLLDEGALLEAAESRHVTDEALDLLLDKVEVPAASRKLLRPEQELGPNHLLVDAIRSPDGSFSILWAKAPKDEYADDKYKEVAITIVSPDGSQRVAATGNCKGANQIAQWAAPEGPRVIAIKERAVQLLDDHFKVVAKATLPEEFEGAYGLEVITGRRFALLHQNRAALLVDTALQTAGAYEDSGYGSWAFLDAPDGQMPIVCATTYSGIRTIFLTPDKEAPPIKIADYDEPILAARTDDGGFFIDYKTKKKGERRRIRLGENGWEKIPVEMPSRPVIDYFSANDDSWVTATGGELIGYVDHTDPPVIVDFTGRKVAVCPNAPGSCEVIDLASGAAIFQDAIATDPTLAARIAAAPHVRAARLPGRAPAQGGAPLPRALYADKAGLAARLRAELDQREAGRAALAVLGAHAGAVLEAAAATLMPLLAARAAVLDALAAPAPSPPRIPRHAPGVRRTEVRRAVRTAFSEPLDGLVFWALDGNDPRPVVSYLVPAGEPVHPKAWSVAVRLVGLAQTARSGRPLAERALGLAEAIADALDAAGARFRIDAAELDLDDDEDDDDDDDDGDEVIELRKLPDDDDGDGTELLLGPRGKYPKREMPVRWESDRASRAAALRQWIEGSFLAPLAPASLSTLREKPVSAVHRAEVNLGDHTFHVHIGTSHREDGLTWKIVDVSGVGPLDAWHLLFERVEAAIATSASASPSRSLIWPASGVPRREDLESLRRGIALTRAHLDDRRALRPEGWPVPEIKGVDDPKHRRFVLLAWVLGEIEASAVGSTNAVFEKIEKATKLATHHWGRLRPQRDKGKTLEISPEFGRLRLTSLARAPIHGQSELDDIVVLRSPDEIAGAFAKEAGLVASPATRSGGRR